MGQKLKKCLILSLLYILFKNDGVIALLDYANFNREMFRRRRHVGGPFNGLTILYKNNPASKKRKTDLAVGSSKAKRRKISRKKSIPKKKARKRTKKRSRKTPKRRKNRKKKVKRVVVKRRRKAKKTSKKFGKKKTKKSKAKNAPLSILD